MTFVAEHTVQRSAIVAGADVVAPCMLVVQPLTLTVFLGLVVLLSVLDQPPLSFPGGLFMGARKTVADGLFTRSRLQLLDDSLPRLRAVLPLGVVLRSRLHAGLCSARGRPFVAGWCVVGAVAIAVLRHVENPFEVFAGA
jgi:hypothetical protein